MPACVQVSSRSLARALLAGDFNSGAILNLLAEHLLAAGICESSPSASEEAERRYPGVLAAVDRIITSDTSRGVTSRYVWEDGPESSRLVNCRIIGSQEDARRLDLRDQIITMMEAGLFADPRDFELAAGHLMDVYGAPPNDRGVTQYVADKGFDFYATLSTARPLGTRRFEGQPWRIVGQAKRYSGSVCSDEVEAFGARVVGVRNDNPNFMSPFSDGFRANGNPVLGLFVTTGTFQSGALSAARRHLIVTLDRPQIAEDLAASPASSRWVDSTGDFIPEKFLSHLRTLHGLSPS